MEPRRVYRLCGAYRRWIARLPTDDPDAAVIREVLLEMCAEL
jgi:hypothetical protein